MTSKTFEPNAVFSGLAADDAAVIAARSVETWEALAATLAPLIGEHGFSILFARCAHQTRAAHPWLALAPLAAGAGRFAALGELLRARDGADALAASAALLATFHDALAGLIGAPLTHSLLRAASGGGSSPAEEMSP